MITVISLYLIIGIGIFYLSSYVGNQFVEYESVSSFEFKENCQSFNLIYRIFFPVIVTFIIVNILEYLNISCPYYWIIVLIYWIYRILFILFMDRIKLANKFYIFITFIISLSFSIFIYYISTVDNKFLLPTRDNLVSQIWIVIILFFYNFLTRIYSKFITDESRKNRLKIYSISKLELFFPKYIDYIKKITCDMNAISIIFSIMIVENFNRPKIIRYFEKKFPYFFNTKGIMQIESKENISDIESVKIATERIVNIYKQLLKEYNNEFDYFIFINKIASDYNSNPNYPLMVREIYYEIRNSKYFSEEICQS